MSDTDKIQQAIDKRVPLKAGCYTVEDFLKIPSGAVIDWPGVTICIADKPWQQNAHDRMGVFNCERVSDVVIRRLHIIGVEGFMHDTETARAIYWKDCNRVVVEDCILENHNSEGFWGDVHGGRFENNRFINVGNAAPGDRWTHLPALQPFGSDLVLRHNTFKDCGSGMGPTGSNILIEKNIVRGAKLGGIATGDSAHMGEGPCTVRNNFVSATDGAAIRIVGARDPSINTVDNNTVECTGDAVGIWVDSPKHVQARENRLLLHDKAIGLIAHGQNNRSVLLDTERNEFRCFDKATGIRATPSTGREITHRSRGDSVFGVTNRDIAADWAQYRGGKVTAIVDALFVESGHVRDVEGKMHPMTSEHWSSADG